MNVLSKMKSYLDNLKEIISYYGAAIYVAKDKTDDGVDGRIVCHTDKNSYISEQYKAMRTNLYSLATDKPFKTILITSAHPSEGKTITSCNLAMAISLDIGKKVVLVDADLRTPEVHNAFGLPRKPGFSDILNDTVKLDDILKKPVVDNLYIITAGTHVQSPSEIWISPKIGSIIEELKKRFDYVIFDAPPTLNVSDSGILGVLCDCVLQVVKANVTQRSAVEEAFNLLRDAQAKPMATILTNYNAPLFCFSRYKYYRYPYYKSKS